MPYEITFNMFWQTQKYLPFLKREVLAGFISEAGDQAPTERQIALLDSLDALTDEINPLLSAWAKKDFRRRLENWGMTPEELNEELDMEIDEQNIQNHFSINQVIIPRIGNCNRDYIFLCGSCDWDEEHGIEFLLENGKPVRSDAQGELSLSGEWNKYLARQE